MGDTFTVGASTRLFVFEGPDANGPPDMNASHASSASTSRDDDASPTQEDGEDEDSQTRQRRKTRRAKDVMLDDDEDCDDETRSSSRKRRRNGWGGNEEDRRREKKAWTREELERDLVELNERHERCGKEIERAKMNRLMSSDPNGGDSLDAYMCESRRAMHEEELSRLSKNRREIERDMESYVRTLRAIRDEFKSLDWRAVLDVLLKERTRRHEENAAKAALESSRRYMNAKMSNARSVSETNKRAFPAQMRFATPKTVPCSTPTSTSSGSTKRTAASSTTSVQPMLPPPQRSVPLGPMRPPASRPRPTANTAKDDMTTTTTSTTSAVSKSAVSKSARRRARRRRRARDVDESSAHKKRSKTTIDSSTLDDGTLAWTPPKGQSGDGRTDLNAKLGY